MQNPAWFSRRYPTFSDFEDLAQTYGALIGIGDCPGALFVPPGVMGKNSPPLLLIPERSGLLERMWFLAHELAHLQKHSGAPCATRATKVEAQADRWAAEALIPEAAVRRYRNASEDAFIAALSAHYEDLPAYNCPARRLAGTIARIRLSLVEDRQENNEEAV
jgi:Zn-dependent peptidase ImmA (M78 family)